MVMLCSSHTHVHTLTHIKMQECKQMRSGEVLEVLTLMEADFLFLCECEKSVYSTVISVCSCTEQKFT